jgi:hypothetical protein
MLSNHNHHHHHHHNNNNKDHHTRWQLRQELDMLSRFTGHDSWDKYTQNWMRQLARRFAVRIGPKESVQRVRLVGHELVVVGTARQWRFHLTCGRTEVSPPLPRHRQFIPSWDGDRLFSMHYDAALARHVIEVDGQSLATTTRAPSFVHEARDGATAVIGLCSEEMMMVSGLREAPMASPPRTHRVPMDDVALASVPFRQYVFSGLLRGDLHVYDVESGRGMQFAPPRLHSKDMRSPPPPSPPVRSIDVDRQGPLYTVHMGCQDGTIKMLRLEAQPQQEGLQQVSQPSTRHVHRHPVTTVVSHAHKVASCDESGHVVVADVHGTRTMYDLAFDADNDGVAIDMNARFLVVGHGDTVHVWDHENAWELPRRPGPNKAQARRRRGGGGGSRGGIPV